MRIGRSGLLLLSLLLATLAARAQSSVADPMAPYRRELALVHTDSARGRLNTALSTLSPSSDSTCYYALRAIAQLDRALPVANATERRRLVGIKGVAFNNLGAGHSNSGNWRQGMRDYQQALKLLRQSGDIDGQINTLVNIGDENREQGNYLAALQCYQSGVRLGEHVPAVQKRFAYCLATLGTLHRLLGNDSTALRLQLRAVGILEHIADTQGLISSLPETLGTSLNHLATTYLEAFGDTAKANSYAYRTQLLHTPAYVQNTALALRGKVQLLEGHWAQARALLLAAESHTLADHDVAKLAEIQNNLALLEEKTGHLALALRYARQAAAAGLQNQPVNRSRSAEILARLYEKLGQPQLALATLKHFVVLRDSISNEATKRKVLGQALRADYELRTTAMRAEQAVTTANLHRQRVLLWALGGGLGLLALLAAQQWRSHRRQQRANAQLAAQNAQIEEQAARLGQLDAAKNQFFANVSHELRTPLTLVLGPLDGLLTPPAPALPAAARESVALAHRSARRLLELVNRILDLTKLQAGRLELHPAPTAVAPLLRRVVTQFESLAAERRVALVAPQALPEDLRLLLDADKVEQILTNLLINALNHTPAGGAVTVGAALPDAGGQYVLSVRDTGPGIAEAEQARVFERFYQSPQRQAQGGTGLGLALSRELATLLGGTLTLESAPGLGAAFTLRFPAAVLPPEAAEAPEPDYLEETPDEDEAEPAADDSLGFPIQHSELKIHNSTKPRVLVVEDQADLRAYLRQLLAPAYEVLTAVDGQDALEVLAREAPVDLITTDAMMPRLSGTELLACLKADPARAGLPVLMLTARADEAHRLATLTVGVDDYLTKPFVPAELLARVGTLLRRHAVRRQFASQPPDAPAPAEDPAQQTQPAEAGPISLTAAPDAAATSAEGAQGAEQLARWQAQLGERLADPAFGPAELAGLLCLSERTLYRRLGELAGLTPAAWLRELRLDRARQLLEAGNFGSVADVADAAGFVNARSFAARYAERFGRRPHSYHT